MVVVLFADAGPVVVVWGAVVVDVTAAPAPTSTVFCSIG